MTKILYIAGYGRCGSTILDIILSSHPEITGVGEVTFLLDDWANSSRHCSCGTAYQKCDFWKGLFSNQTPLPQMTQLTRKIEKRSSVLRLLLGAISREDRQGYRAYHEKVLAHIVSQTGSSIVIDSSKSARDALGRFVALSRLAGQDVYVLHLVRDGFAVMESQIITGDNWALEGETTSYRWPALRTAFGWVMTNAWVPLLGRLIGPNRYMLLRYEDFIENPVVALQAIGQFCGFDAGVLIERINHDDYFNVGHMVGGNRVRLEGKLKLKRPTRRKYGDRLKLYQRVIFACLGGWLQHLYGYR
jgi:hypothetical protein